MHHHEDDADEGADVSFEREIREKSRPYIAHRAMNGSMEGFRGRYFAALPELLA